jgi:hypothetical protein
MAENKKQSIIEEALKDANLFAEGMEKNAKEILRSIAIEEIGGIVNESLNEDEFDNDEDSSNDSEVGGELDVDTPSADGEEENLEAGEESEEVATDFGGEAEDDLAVAGDVESEEGSVDYDSEEGMASDEDEFEFDMTTASDDDVISVFKKLSAEDEIEIIDDNEVHITDPTSGSEYHVKLGGAKTEAPVADVDSAIEMGGESPVADVDSAIEMGGEDETEEFEYEVELGSDDEEEVEEGVNEDIVRGKGHDTYAGGGSLPSGDMEGQKAEKDADTGDNLTGGFDDDAVSHANAEGPMVMAEDEVNEEEEINEEEVNEEEVDESIAVGNAEARRVPGQADNGAPEGPGARALKESKEYQELKGKYNALIKENDEIKAGLKKFRNMLNEVGVFNSNLTYAMKLFTEHSTTQEEKLNILKRFDNEASTIKESKNVYKSVLESISKKPMIQETVGNKIGKEAITSSKSQINETTAYEDESTKRMKALMGIRN